MHKTQIFYLSKITVSLIFPYRKIVGKFYAPKIFGFDSANEPDFVCFKNKVSINISIVREV